MSSKGWKTQSPRGPISIDPQTRDIVQTIYVRRVEKKGGELWNVEFDKFEQRAPTAEAALSGGARNRRGVRLRARSITPSARRPSSAGCGFLIPEEVERAPHGLRERDRRSSPAGDRTPEQAASIAPLRVACAMISM